LQAKLDIVLLMVVDMMLILWRSIVADYLIYTLLEFQKPFMVSYL